MNAGTLRRRILLFAGCVCSATTGISQEPIDWLDGSWTKLRIKVTGEVVDANGQPAKDFKLNAEWDDQKTAVVIEENRFHFWIPAGRQKWLAVGLEASAQDGRLAARKVLRAFDVRRAAIQGVTLRLEPTQREVRVSVVDDGKPVPNATVAARLMSRSMPRAKTDANGVATLHLMSYDSVFQLTAWTEDFRAGGFSFHRDPPRDPLATEYTVEIVKCRPQRVRLINAADGLPIPDVSFELVVGTGAPNHQFPGKIPEIFLTTDAKGEAVCRWFPDWKTHGSYTDLKTADWVKAGKNETTEGVIVQTLRESSDRKRVVGRVKAVAPGIGVAGLCVEAWSFQGEEENRSDALFSFTDKEGRFFLDYLHGSKYSIYVNDSRLASPVQHLVVYDPETQTKTSPELTVQKGVPVELRVTSGEEHKPVRHQFINLTRKEAEPGRRFYATTNNDGRATTYVLPGCELEASIYTPFWRTTRSIKTKKDGSTVFNMHHDPDAGTKEKK